MTAGPRTQPTDIARRLRLQLWAGAFQLLSLTPSRLDNRHSARPSTISLDARARATRKLLQAVRLQRTGDSDAHFNWPDRVVGIWHDLE